MSQALCMQPTLAILHLTMYIHVNNIAQTRLTNNVVVCNFVTSL